MIGLLCFPTSSAAGGMYCAIMGGDFMNMFNAAVQMPKGSLTQLSGMHTYRFMPEKDT